ncbi:hypothetical protein GCM10028806_27140 [Spirosoma terrae]
MEAQAITASDSVLLAHSYYQYGRTYSFAGDNVQAKRYYVKALKILENRPASYDLGHLYVRICEYNNVSIDSREDVEYLNKAIAIFKEINSPQGLATAYGMLQGAYGWRWVGTFTEDSPRFDSLLAINDLELKYAQLARDTSFIVDAYVRYGGLYNIVHNTNASLANLQKALTIANKSQNDTLRIRSLLGFSDTYIGLRKPDQARPYIAEVEAIYKRNNYQQFFILRHLLYSWRDYYQQKGYWKQAFEKLNIVNQLLNDSELANFDKTTSIVNQELDAQKTALVMTAQKKEIELTNRLVNTQRTFIIVTITLLAGALTLSAFFFRLYRKHQRISKENALISYKNEQLVREQNHRVKNNLQMVSSLLNMQARQLADTDARQAILESKLRVQAMAIIQRKLYDSTHLTTLNLADFIPEIAENALAACGFAGITKRFDIAPIRLNVDQTIPVGLIITELIVNASKYAFPNNHAPILTIDCTQSEQTIRLQLADNGSEDFMEEGQFGLAIRQHQQNSTSFGSQLIALQVQQLYGTYQYKHRESGTEFSMEFSV